MFITQAKEIMEACPTARLDAKDAQRLIRSVEEEEDSLLEPLLGESLMHRLNSQYRTMVKQFGGITTDKVNTACEFSDEAQNPSYIMMSELCGENKLFADHTACIATIALLRDIQSALVNRMFSNKIYTISTSLNLGGGANRASAGDYDPADDKHLKELRSEFWMNSMHACDNILNKLEKDAKNRPTSDEDNSGVYSLWYDLWKDSDGFFMKEDTLFPTLRDLKKFYPCDQPTRFLAVQPLLLYCQNTYITPRVNEVAPDLMDVLLDPTHQLTVEERKAKKLLRIALSYHMQAHQANKATSKNATPFSSSPGIYSISPDKTELAQSADSAMSTALAYIKKMVESRPPVEDMEDDMQNTPERKGSSCNIYPGHEDHVDNVPSGSGSHGGCCCKGRGDDEYTTFSTLMPGLNRW